MSTISEASPLLLGSASPRRRELLATLRLPLVVHAVGVEEGELPGESPEQYVHRVTQAKLRATSGSVKQQPLPHSAVLVADTIVVLAGKILGKPGDVADAVRLLQMLAGQTHQVLTCYRIARPGEEAWVTRVVCTDVSMRSATTSEIHSYAETGEGLDKAGAYALQGLGAFLVERINGSHANVIGLPVCEVVADLLEVGLLTRFPLAGSAVAAGGYQGL